MNLFSASPLFIELFYSILCGMNNANVMHTLQAILTDLGIPKELLHPDAKIHQDLQLDSTEIVEISLGLKRRLGVSMKLESREDMTLAQACDRIEATRLSHTSDTSISSTSH